MKRLLVPCDGSDNALRAVGYAAQTASGSKNPTEIILLHVLDPMTFGLPAAALAPEDLIRLRPAQAERVLQPARAILERAGVAYRECCRVGQPAIEIAALLGEEHCEGVIMGTRGLSPFASLMIGSVASRVVSLVDVPVTLIK